MPVIQSIFDLQRSFASIAATEPNVSVRTGIYIHEFLGAVS